MACMRGVKSLSASHCLFYAFNEKPSRHQKL